MISEHGPLCKHFIIPISVLCKDKIFLSGYSFFKIKSEGSKAFRHPIVVLENPREESDNLTIFKSSLLNLNFPVVETLLNRYPYIPRLLLTEKKEFDQETHEVLFGILLYTGRTFDLERLYGICISDGTEKDNILTQQSEKFGSFSSLIYDGILIQRSKSDEERSFAKNIEIQKFIGKGSFGYVFFSKTPDANLALFKYSIFSAEYIRELLSQLMLESLESQINPSFSTCEMIHYHLLGLKFLSSNSRTSLIERFGKKPGIQNLDTRGVELSVFDRMAVLVKELFSKVKDLRDRFVMHLDISPTNVMFDEETGSLEIIDFGGTIGDDSFLNIGPAVSRVCTRTTRAPEYGSRATLWQRNESSEALSSYYAIMSHFFSPTCFTQQPYTKEEECSKIVKDDLDFWDLQWRSKSGGGFSRNEEIPRILRILRRTHQSARSKPRDRPSLDWLLSDGTAESDALALQMGSIGSIPRFLHIRSCLSRFIKNWVFISKTPDVESWKLRRNVFIELLITRIQNLGSDLYDIAYKTPIPPYTFSRCLSLFDAFVSFVNTETDPVFLGYMNDIDSYPALVTAFLYVSLSCSKTSLVDLEHFNDHPVHMILRMLCSHKNLMSLFLSPVTAYALLILETPKSTQNPTTHSEPCPENSHRIIRCLYNTQKGQRCQPMFGGQMSKISKFYHYYLSSLISQPFSFESEREWWIFLRKTRFNPEELYFPDLSEKATSFINKQIEIWF